VDKETWNQQKKHAIELSEQIADLLRLTRRMAYSCPIEFISSSFYILYERQRIEVRTVCKRVSEIKDQGDSIPNEEEDPEYDTTSLERLQKTLAMETCVLELSSFLFYDLPETENDHKHDVARIINYPLRLIENPEF